MALLSRYIDEARAAETPTLLEKRFAKDCVDTVLRVATRVDDSALRRREVDIIPRIIAKIAAERSRLSEG